MKKTILALAIATMVLTSCDEWLEATSSTQIKATELLSNREGIQDALSGIYINMGNTSSYGRFNTFFANDLAAYPNEMMTTSQYNQWQQHMYTTSNSKSNINAGWRTNYNVIADVNFLLRELPSRKEMMSEAEYNYIIGELYGLRAFIHFDIMRMWGVSEWNEENAAKMTIPYVTEYTAQATPQRSYAETEKLLTADIDSALVHLAEDPVRGFRPKSFDNVINAEGYWNNREKHLNYYGVKALQMRVLQWKHDYAGAGAIAQELIDEIKATGACRWTKPEEQRVLTDNASKDWTFSTEHIFSLEITTLASNYSGFLIADSISDGERISNAFVDNTLFPATDPETGLMSGIEDLRGPSWQLVYTSKGYNSYKLYQPTGYYSKYRNRLPVIKLPELYYVLSESKLEAQDTVSALACLDTVRKYRGITDAIPATQNGVTELAKELYREFTCEGQVFYWLKQSHLKYRLYPSFNVEEKDLTYPYPDDETTYGRKQEL